MIVPSLSVPSLTMWAPTGRSHLSSLASGAKYAMHLVLGFPHPPPLWPKLLCFVCITIGIRYEYIITTNCAWLARTNTTYSAFCSQRLHIWNWHLNTLSIHCDLLKLMCCLLTSNGLPALCLWLALNTEFENPTHLRSILEKKRRSWPLRKLSWH